MKRNSYRLLFIAVLLSGCIQSNPANDTTQGLNVQSTLTAPAAITVPAPTVNEAPSGDLYLGDLGASATVRVTYPAMAIGHTVGLRWTGHTTYNAPVQKVSTVGTLTFTIPKTTITADQGSSATLTSSVGVGSNPLVISAPLNVRVIDGSAPGNPLTGAAVAQHLNARYRDTRATCPGSLPAYYCDGVLIRATNDENFDPWDPSPSAIKLGAVSFSWMRVDAHVTALFNVSGFIFLAQNDALAQGKAPTFLCVYAYNAITVGHPVKGCGLLTRRADISTCSTVGVRTVAQWTSYHAKLAANKQCSLSTADATQFATSYQVRSTSRPWSAWNEVLIAVWPAGTPTQLPLEAFYHVGSSGLSEARHYQTKYKARTGGWLPIIKLDFAQASGTPFSYNASDQAVQP